jgi:hypothetical protein
MEEAGSSNLPKPTFRSLTYSLEIVKNRSDQQYDQVHLGDAFDRQSLDSTEHVLFLGVIPLLKESNWSLVTDRYSTQLLCELTAFETTR